MTENRDLKRLVRERMARSGPPKPAVIALPRELDAGRPVPCTVAGPPAADAYREAGTRWHRLAAAALTASNGRRRR